jgi:FtsP/CotA-like multicopper oxidase with cupredoxin domain/transposase
LAVLVAPANKQERAQIAERAAQVQAVTGERGEVALVGQGSTGEQSAEAASAQGMRREVVKLPHAKRGFVVLPLRWMVERSCGWMARSRRLARADERLPATLAGLHFLAFAILTLRRLACRYHRCSQDRAEGCSQRAERGGPRGLAASPLALAGGVDQTLPEERETTRCFCEKLARSKLHAVTEGEEMRMRFQRLYRVFVLALFLAALSACAERQPAASSQPPTDTSMPGMDHGALAQATSQAQPPTDASMPGMQHGQTAQPQPTSAPAMPDMDHGGGTQTEGGHTMAPVDVSSAPAAAPDARGNQLLEPKLVNGVKEFELTTSVIKWNILPEVQVGAYAYNGQVPGPLIRVNAGDQVRVRVKNNLPEPTSVHWHGLIIPNAQDGTADVTQPPIKPGETFTYEYTVPNTPGTFFYHTHVQVDRQQPLGLYGALIIDDPTAQPDASQDHIIELGEWRVVDGQTFPAMEFDGMLPNFFTINGKSYPATETINARVGDRIMFRFVGTGQFIHPMHIHGGPFEIVATDGNPVPEAARLMKDTVLVGPGERYDVVWTAREPGKWLLHCHINHHVTNNGAEIAGGGGLTMVINVTE